MKGKSSYNLGPSWQNRFGAPPPPAASTPWWIERRQELLAIAQTHSPSYAYNLPSVDGVIGRLATLTSLDGLFYAIKANRNPDILRVIHERGLGFECVSPGEIDHIFGLFPDIDPKRILFTPNFAPASEYQFGLDKGVNVTIDNLHPVKSWPNIFRDQSIFVRVDPGQGRGHHSFVKTAGAQSKFGLWPSQLDELERTLAAINTTVIGLHTHTRVQGFASRTTGTKSRSFSLA